MPLLCAVDMCVALLDLHSSLFQVLQPARMHFDRLSNLKMEHGLALIKCLMSVVMVIGSLHDEVKNVLP